MARRSFRLWILSACLAVSLASAGVWLAHGRVLFSVGPSADPAAEGALERLFEPTGVQDGLGAVEGMERGFRLGLLPSGFGSGLLSVSTVLALVAVVWIISSARRPSGASRRGRPRRPACP